MSTMICNIDVPNDRPICRDDKSLENSFTEVSIDSSYKSFDYECHSPKDVRFQVGVVHLVQEDSSSEQYPSPEALGYQDVMPQLENHIAPRRSSRHAVGEGLVPRRRSLARSDCRASNELSPGLQFSRRNSLTRSDHMSISSMDAAVLDSADAENSPSRGVTRRRSSMQALLQNMEASPSSSSSSHKRGVARRASMAGLRNRTSQP